MSRNEIKLRKKKMGAGDIQRYRNYSLLLKQLERTKRFKRALRFFLYSLLITMFILFLVALVGYFMLRLEKQKGQKPKENSATSWVQPTSQI